MGADSFKVFMTVTLPLIKDSFLSGLVTAFVRSITAISAIILLVTPQFLLITVQINEFAEKGSYGRGLRLCHRSDRHHLRLGAADESVHQVFRYQPKHQGGQVNHG